MQKMTGGGGGGGGGGGAQGWASHAFILPPPPPGNAEGAHPSKRSTPSPRIDHIISGLT